MSLCFASTCTSASSHKGFLLDDCLLNVFADAGAVAVAVKLTLFEI
jgi:hypothetical protein